MTIASATNKSGPYNGNGVTVAFAGTFKISDQDHVQVILADADGVETVQTITTEYTVSGVGGSGFTVTMLVAPPSGSTVTLIRDVPFTQELDLQNQGAYYAETIEEAFDAGVARDQQLQEQVSRSVKIPASADVAELDTLIANIVLLGDSADDLAALAAISADVETLSTITAQISTVAGISVAVTTVAGISVAVQSVAAVEAELLDIHSDLAALLAVPAAAAASASAASGSASAADASADAAAASAAAAAVFNPANYMATASYPTLVSIEALTLAAGDILYSTGPDTMVKLAKGTALQQLRMNAGATAPEWSAAASGAPKRNRIVNGAMQVSQENGNTAGTTNGYYVAAQFAVYRPTSAGTITAQRVQSVTPNGSKDRARITITAADASLAAGEFLTFNQNIEGQEVADFRYGSASAKQSILRFGFKGPQGTYAVSVKNSALNRSYVALFTISAPEANVDTEQTLVIPGDTTGTWLTDTGIGLSIDIVLACGSTYQGTTGWQAGNILGTSGVSNGMGTISAVFEVFDVGLYADPDSTGVAPPWELPDYDDTERQCMRYWELIGGIASYPSFGANSAGAASFLSYIQWVVRKRTTPIVTKNGTWFVSNCGQPAPGIPNDQGCRIVISVTGAGTWAAEPNSSDDTITANARM